MLNLKAIGVNMKRTKNIWRNMWKRCGGLSGENKGSLKYKGIIFVDNEWRSFENFISDMGLAPEGYTLDRLNNSKSYCKSNCRWATPKEQTRNRSTTIIVKYSEKDWFLKDLAEHLGIRYDTLWRRIKAGWLEKDLGNKPNKGSGAISKRVRTINYYGKSYYLNDLASKLNIPPETLWSRYLRGWTNSELNKPIP